MRSYWESLYREKRDAADPEAFRPACIPDFSIYGNRLLALMHRRAFLSLFNKMEDLPGTWLDLGCGGGRWLGILSNRGIKPCGLDIAYEALLGIRSRESLNVVQGSAALLPFRNDSFPALSHVTVLQHLPYDLQEAAGNQIRRIMNKSGHWLLLEHLAPPDKKKEALGWEGMYPRSAAEWFSFVQSRGFRPLALLRFQYIPCTRRALAFFRGLEATRKNLSKPKSPIQANPSPSPAQGFAGGVSDSFRLRTYRGLRTMAYNLTLTADLFLDYFFALRRGSHVAILSIKE